MLVEIHGAGFVNKGAELMLRTTIRELATRIADFQPSLIPTDNHYISRVGLGARQILLNPNRTKDISGRLIHLASVLRPRSTKRFLERFGLLLGDEPSALIDISGFALSDQWGVKTGGKIEAAVGSYARQGKPVVLLPQALGPFQDPAVRSMFRRISSNCSLIFARDQQSFEFAREATTHPDRLFLAPDITLFAESHVGNLASADSDYACLVPNYRMIDRGSSHVSSHYRSQLQQIAGLIITRGLEIKIIVHSNEPGDKQLATELKQQLGNGRVVVVNELDPFKLKQVISGGRFLVGSRFHSLVSAFSTNVPSICLGWSHKYNMLFRDFGVDEFVLEVNDDLSALSQKVEILANAESNREVRRKIGVQLTAMVTDNQRMWEKVVAVLQGTSVG